MLSITGEEANGWQWSPGTLTTFCFMIFAAIICLHMLDRAKIKAAIPKAPTVIPE